MKNILKNYQEDIVKSTKTSLLIELNSNDLKFFDESIEKNTYFQDENFVFNLSLMMVKDIYDFPLQNKKTTNLIYIDTDKKINYKNSILLEQIIEQIEDSLKKIYNLQIAKEGIKVLLDTLSSGVGQIFNGKNYIADIITENIGEYLTGDIIDTSIEKMVNYSIDELNASVLDKISNKTVNILDNLKDSQLYLSKNAKDRLFEHSKKFNNNMSHPELYQFIIKILIDLSINMPKVIFIKNPHKLDINSINILSFLLLLSKNLKDENKNIGISLVYVYEDKNYRQYGKCEEKYKINQKLLYEQRIFAQRYSMLETPNSDIPHIAVKSNLFVGRTQELDKLKESYIFSKENKNRIVMQVVSAEAGTGKTKLVKKHIDEIRKEEKNGHLLIQLNIFNNPGHISLNSGLGSLINSILEEGERLKDLKSFFEKNIDNLKNKTFEIIFESLKNLLNGNLIDSSKTIYDRVNLERNIKSFYEKELENKSYNDNKELMFEKINKAISKLELFSDSSMPIILFIDDLQWIDEASSEYILNYLIKKFNVYIIATLRSSDGVTALKDALENKSLNKFKITLLENSKVFVNNKANSESMLNKELICNRFELLGFNRKLLTTLISQTIEGNSNQHNILCDLIFDMLSSDSNKEVVNTLFAIETINILCDEKFYNDCDCLIIKNSFDKKTLFKFNPKIIDIEYFIKNLLNSLKNKYKDSFEHPSSNSFVQNFTLMSYAILEERLNILKIYFSEYGNAAINTLILSSILGTPFNSNIIKRFLEKLSTTEEETLMLLKTYVNQVENKVDNKVFLLSEHYEIIEQVYEILCKYASINNSYSYRHSLFEIFLRKQFETAFFDLFPQKLKKESINKFYEILYEITIEEENNEKSSNELISLDNNEPFHNLIYFDLIKMNILKNAYLNDKKWFPDLSSTINKCVVHYRNYLELSTPIKLLEEIKDFDLKFEYLDEYLVSMNNLAELYISTKQIDKAETLLEDLLEYIHDKKLDLSSYTYLMIINNLSCAYHTKIKSVEAINLLESTKLFIEKNIDQSKYNDLLVEYYCISMSNLSVYYKNINIDKSIKYEELSYNFIKKYFEKDNRKWALLYIKRGCDYSLLLRNKKPKLARSIINEIIILNEENLIIDESFWLPHYVKILNVFGLIVSRKDKEKRIQIFKKAVDISFENFKKETIISIWTDLYIQSLSNLSNEYLNYNNEEAMLYFNELLKIQENLYKDNPIIFGKEYLYTIFDVASLFVKTNKLSDMIAFLEKGLLVAQNLYEKSSQFRNEYKKTLIYLLKFSNDDIKKIYWENLLNRL